MCLDIDFKVCGNVGRKREGSLCFNKTIIINYGLIVNKMIIHSLNVRSIFFINYFTKHRADLVSQFILNDLKNTNTIQARITL